MNRIELEWNRVIDMINARNTETFGIEKTRGKGGEREIQDEKGNDLNSAEKVLGKNCAVDIVVAVGLSTAGV